MSDRRVFLGIQLIFTDLKLDDFEFVSFLLCKEELVLGDEFIFLIFEVDLFFFERLINLMVFLSQENEFLFAFLDVLIIKIEP